MNKKLSKSLVAKLLQLFISYKNAKQGYRV